MSQQQEYKSLDSVVEEETAHLKSDRYDKHVSKSKQYKWLLVGTIVLMAFSSPWLGDISYAIGFFIAPFVYGLLIVGTFWLAERVHNMFSKQPWSKISRNYVNYSLWVSFILSVAVSIPSFVAVWEGFKHGISNT